MSVIPILRVPLLAVMAVRGAKQPAERGRGVRGEIKVGQHQDAPPLQVALGEAADDARGIGGRWLDLECRAVGGALLGHAKQWRETPDVQVRRRKPRSITLASGDGAALRAAIAQRSCGCT